MHRSVTDRLEVKELRGKWNQTKNHMRVIFSLRIWFPGSSVSHGMDSGKSTAVSCGESVFCFSFLFPCKKTSAILAGFNFGHFGSLKTITKIFCMLRRVHFINVNMYTIDFNSIPVFGHLINQMIFSLTNLISSYLLLSFPLFDIKQLFITRIL